jgi:hypothetical protein
MSNWIEHLDELASVETDVKKKVAFQSSSRLIKELAKGGAELRAELEALKSASLVPWPINDAIIKLTEAAAILLDEKSYDGHGHEEIRAALNAAKDYTNKI